MFGLSGVFLHTITTVYLRQVLYHKCLESNECHRILILIKIFNRPGRGVENKIEYCSDTG